MTDTKHTPTPWKVVPHTGTRLPDKIFMIVGASEVVCGDDGICVPDNMNDRSFVEDEVNMRHIVKCVNMHDELVAELKSCTIELRKWQSATKETDDLFRSVLKTLKKAGAL